MPAATSTTTTIETVPAAPADAMTGSIPRRIVWCWLLPVCAAVLAAALADLVLILTQVYGPSSATHLGGVATWLRLLPQVAAGSLARVVLPASALCGILYLLRTGKAPFRFPLAAGLALSLGWVGAMLAVLPPQAPPVYQVTIGSPLAPVPRDPAAWPPFGPAYFPYIEAGVALAAAALASSIRKLRD